MVSVLYLINKTKSNPEDAKRLIREMLGYLTFPTSTLGDDTFIRSLTCLRSMVEWMMEEITNQEFDKEDIINRVKLSTKSDPEILSNLSAYLDDSGDNSRDIKRIRTILSEIRFELNGNRIRKTISAANHKINFSGTAVDHKEIIRDLQVKLSTLIDQGGGAEKSGFVGRINITQIDQMADIFTKAKESNDTHGILKTGLVGQNRMLGIGGFRRGEMINYGALTHHYKTGILNDLARQIPMYNVPWMWDEKKKPLVLRVSFENKLEQDLPMIYRSLMEQDTNAKIDISEVDPVKAAQYIKKRLGVNGYVFAMECYDPNNFDVYDLLDLLNRYEAEGYEIHMLLVDYLELIAKNGSADRRDESINDAFEVLRNHCFPRGITVATAHQLSSAAIDLQREGVDNFAERVSTGAYYRNTKSLNQKLDVEILMYILVRQGRSFLTMARGKHRGQDSTPAKHKTFAYEFMPIGGIRDDINDEVPRVIYNLNEYLAETSDAQSSVVSLETPNTSEAW